MEPNVLKIILGICHDNNYKIRLDGASFIREYLQIEKIRESPRFNDIYLPELIELLNDEEAFIRIEAIEIMTDLLQYFDQD